MNSREREILNSKKKEKEQQQINENKKNLAKKVFRTVDKRRRQCTLENTI